MQARPDEGSTDQCCPCVSTSSPSRGGHGVHRQVFTKQVSQVLMWNVVPMEAQHVSAPREKSAALLQNIQAEIFVNYTGRCATRLLICTLVCLPHGVVLKASFICRACACVRVWRMSVIREAWLVSLNYLQLRGGCEGLCLLKAWPAPLIRLS